MPLVRQFAGPLRPGRLGAAALLMLVFPRAAAAFEGRVVLPDGTPVMGATVSVVGLAGAGRTGHEGRFVWQPDPPVPFEIFVLMANGQAMAPVRIEAIPPGAVIEIRVRPLITETARVVTEAAPNILSPPASAVARIDRADIEARHAPNVTAAVADLPGTGQLEEGHSAVPSLRGMARGRTLILLDGARVTAERRAGPSATYLDPFILEDVEVARGPGSVAYGSDAFGGVIHARTRQAAMGAEPSMRFRAVAGTGIPEAGAAVEASGGVGDGGILASARYRDFGDYDSPTEEVANSAAEDRGFLLRFNRRAGPGRLAAGWQSDAGRDIGKPSEDPDVVLTSYPEETSHRLTLAYDLEPRGGFTAVTFESFWGRYALITERRTLPTATTGLSVASSDVDAHDYGLRGVARRPAGGGYFEFGVDLNGRSGLQADEAFTEYDATGALITDTRTTSIEDADRFDAGLFVGGETPLPGGAGVAGGLRGDRVTTHNRGGSIGDRSTEETTWSGFAAVNFDLTHGWSATAQAARGFRDPTLSDRYFVGTTGRGFVTGNPDLDPETSLQFDLALRHAGDRVRWAFYAWQYRIEDLIERFEGPDDMDPQTPPQFFFRNHGTARLRGVEFEARATLGRGLVIEFVAQAASGVTLDDDMPVADVPPEGAVLTLRRPFGERADLLFRAAGYLRDDDAGPTEEDTPGYGVFDLGGGWKINDVADLRLLVRNLLDHVYPGSPDSQSVSAPGRAAVLTLNLTF